MPVFTTVRRRQRVRNSYAELESASGFSTSYVSTPVKERWAEGWTAQRGPAPQLQGAHADALGSLRRRSREERQ
eukprot:1004128-Rhodomonas_salina.1